VTGADLLKENLIEKKIIVLVGAGGVGKTTVSAALGLLLAEAGKNVLVLTIDPARRLADSLGIKLKGNEPEEVYISGKGRMSALMLDSKKTFDGMIARVVKDAEARERILNNRYYQYISTLVTGSHEYMAMEKLYEIDEEGKFDIVVLDTPPSRNAEDFLEAPRSLLDVFDSGVLNFFVSSYSRVVRFGIRTFSKGLRGFSRLLEGIVGTELLEGIADFLMNFEGLYGGFRERAQRIFTMLREESTTFLIVTTPESVRIEETEYFFKRLKEYGLKVSAIIFNRTLPDFGAVGSEFEEAVSTFGDDNKDMAIIKKLFFGYQKLLEEQKENISVITTAFKGGKFIKIDQMEQDVHSIEGLKHLLAQMKVI
jgi:anion-transporting  ArsA/GET3 family ATPase